MAYSSSSINIIRVFYLYTLTKVGVHLYAPKKFVRTCVPSHYFRVTSVPLWTESRVTVTNGGGERRPCPFVGEALDRDSNVCARAPFVLRAHHQLPSSVPRGGGPRRATKLGRRHHGTA